MGTLKNVITKKKTKQKSLHKSLHAKKKPNV